MKKSTKLLLLILCLVVIIWGGSIVRCEVLTVRHGDTFAHEYTQTGIIAGNDYLKVINISKSKATVYYVSKGTFGNIIHFANSNGQWKLQSWETVWSKNGSADGFMWPYLR